MPKKKSKKIYKKGGGKAEEITIKIPKNFIDTNKVLYGYKSGGQV